MQVLVSRAGLTLNPGQMADLVLAWRQVVGLMALIPRDRRMADDQAFVFRLSPPVDSAKPTQAKPIQNRKGGAQPSSTRPVAARPVSTKPAPDQPAPAKPVATKPVASKPASIKPVPNRPVAAKAASVKPVPNKPVSTNRFFAKRVAAEPALTKPIAAEPDTASRARRAKPDVGQRPARKTARRRR